MKYTHIGIVLAATCAFVASTANAQATAGASANATGGSATAGATSNSRGADARLDSIPSPAPRYGVNTGDIRCIRVGGEWEQWVASGGSQGSFGFATGPVAGSVPIPFFKVPPRWARVKTDGATDEERLALDAVVCGLPPAGPASVAAAQLPPPMPPSIPEPVPAPQAMSPIPNPALERVRRPSVFRRKSVVYRRARLCLPRSTPHAVALTCHVSLFGGKYEASAPCHTTL